MKNLQITSNNNIAIQGSFPGGKPHQAVLLQQKINSIIQQHRSNALPNIYKMDSSRLKLNSTGNPLPNILRKEMESVFNSDFSSVRIHTGPSADSIGALAFTTGSDIYFATGQYNPNTSFGKRLIGHELTHVVQQKNGRVRNPFGSGVAVVQDPGLEAEAERMGIISSGKISTNSGSLIAGSGKQYNLSHKALQAKWVETTLNSEYYRWHTLINGVRWYMHKRLDYDLFYFIVEQPNSKNASMIDSQGYELRRGDFKYYKMDEPPEGEIDLTHKEQESNKWEKTDFAPFIFKVVSHKTNGPRWVEVTSYRLNNNQKKFQDKLLAAKKHPVKPGNTNPGLKSAENIGKYVFHLTTLKNLLFAPNDTTPNTGIIARGLDPAMGGGSGGACETCKVLGDEKMLTGSVNNSKNVVAVTTALSNLKLYANQRHEYTLSEFIKGKYKEIDLIGRESMVLRFKLKKEYIDSMEVDPQHPNDEFVQLIRGQRIAPEEIEGLTSEGWKQIQSFKELSSLFPQKNSTVKLLTVNTTPLPNLWENSQISIPPVILNVLNGANGKLNPMFWNNLDRSIELLAPNWYYIEVLLTAMQIRNPIILFHLRESYQRDLDLVLGYEGRLDEDVQKKVIKLIDKVVQEWNSNRPSLKDF